MWKAIETVVGLTGLLWMSLIICGRWFWVPMLALFALWAVGVWAKASGQRLASLKADLDAKLRR